MLAILEITEPRVAAENFPKQVVETQAWAAGPSQQLWTLSDDRVVSGIR
jgi:hypothetical protein